MLIKQSHIFLSCPNFILLRVVIKTFFFFLVWVYKHRGVASEGHEGQEPCDRIVGFSKPGRVKQVSHPTCRGGPGHGGMLTAVAAEP